MYCRICGKELKENYQFCPDCGSAIISLNPNGVRPYYLNQQRKQEDEMYFKQEKMPKTRIDYIMMALCALSLLFVVIPFKIIIVYIGLTIALISLIVAVTKKLITKQNRVSTIVIILSATSIILQSSWYAFYQLLIK